MLYGKKFKKLGFRFDIEEGDHTDTISQQKTNKSIGPLDQTEDIRTINK